MFTSFKVLTSLLALASNLGIVSADFDLTGSKWIWTPEPLPGGTDYPVGNVSLRRDYYPPNGKIPQSANIIISTDDHYILYVNGREIASQNSVFKAFRYCVPLEAGCNVFAIEGANIGGPAGSAAAIQVRYSDGFVETVYTDAEWHAATGAVPGFQQVAFDDSAWPAATIVGPYGTTAPWGVVSTPPATDNPGPDLTSASWIWTNEVVAGSAPVGGRAFRKTFSLPGGQLADSIVMDIVADNEYTLYINGLVVGSGTNFTTAQRFEVNFVPTDTVTIAVFGRNIDGPAGLLGAAEIRGCVCGCGADAFVVTDSSWKFNINTPPTFIDSGFDDSQWPAAVVEGNYGVAPWGDVTIPTTNSPQSAPLSGAPAASPATVVS